MSRAGVPGLAAEWAEHLARPAYVRLSRDELHVHLDDAATRLVAALGGDPAPARQVGAGLVDADLLDAAVLPDTVAALGRHLPAVARGAGLPVEAAIVVVAAVADGYVARLRARILAEQETVRRAEVRSRHDAEEALHRQALHDPLTRLPNRTAFQHRLGDAFARPGTRIGLCYLDLDRFKIVNDRLGHDVGDALLVTVAGVLDRCVAPRHLVARMGGDEFVILAEDPSAGELDAVADAVLTALAEPVHVGDHRLDVSASIGVIECPVDGTTPAEVLKAADVTLYWAKSDGRNRWARFDAERNARDMTRYTLSAGVLAGLDRDEFVVDYQPIVDVGDGRVRGVEALVRWEHPTLGRLGPDRFIDLAEESGSIVALGRHVLHEACERGAEWNAAHPGDPLFVSVNLAVRQCQEPDLVDDVAAVLDKTGLAPHLLQLELTESALLGPAGRPLEAIGALAAMGIRIAVDDFGTGYSNLGYLPRLPLHTLKLAGVLVDRLREPGTAPDPIVAGLISLAHALGLAVTGEGVETAMQAEWLRVGGCDTAQGWHYARPMSWPNLLVHLLGGRPS